MVVRLPMSGTIAGAPAACTDTEARRAWRVGAALKADCTATLLLRAAAIVKSSMPVFGTAVREEDCENVGAWIGCTSSSTPIN